MPRLPSLLSALLALVAALAAPSSLAAQRLVLPVGARVRVDADALRRHVAHGAAEGRRGDTLLLTRAAQHPMRPPERDTLAVRLPDLARLELSEGRGAGAYRGAWVGALIGALAGGAAGYQGRTESPGAWCLRWPCIARGKRVLYGAWGGAGAGAVFGAAAGALVYGEQWRRLLPRADGEAGPR